MREVKTGCYFSLILPFHEHWPAGSWCTVAVNGTVGTLIGFFFFFRLIEPRDVVFECGPNCGCGPECVNRTSQKRLRFHLEVCLVKTRP